MTLPVDASALVNGAAILLSFIAGYKYAQMVSERKCREQKDEACGMDRDTPIFRDNGEYKMILVVRNDLKMGKGKIAAQCGHAAVGAFQTAMKRVPHIVRRWENSGCAKIAVKVETEEEMMHLRRKADSMRLTTCLIRDAGRTQIEPNSKTVLAIGPAPCHEVDQVTGHLRLL
ncbi:probable peptidyl-tRNA hydrolase 2 [Phlebotomus argentipes]|uniref:probable peptidyl-tRNA hydrolase 2 n=1 Tax=Phlebotomus argentipes TaxID=94469 RepID=UPI0028936901|nr:probable peptidyl-tRNA hydrolase 2 [Phlebotomus argentipes]